METDKSFAEFSFHDQLQSAIDALEFKTPTPIQLKAIPQILQGHDIAGLAQTGTGKTAAFLIPIIERILRSGEGQNFEERGFDTWAENNFVLCLVPTRELAEQVKDCAMDFIKDSEHRCVVVYGGVSIEKQINQLEKGFTFLIATPGRLIDLYKQHKVDLKQIKVVIFDEADRMFDMGFKDDMKYILKRIPDNRQLLMFSATLNLDVYNVAYQFGSNPVEINVSQDKTTADNVDDFIYHLGQHEKPPHLLALFEKEKPNQVIIFTNFKSNVDRIAEFLNRNGHKAVGISSLMNQSQRKRVMSRFRHEDGENILVATDVAARGLDIDGVDLVINFELPEDAENYVHRIGRTGRAGEKGKAFSFVSDKDVEALERITKYLDRKIDTEWMETSDLPEEFEAFPAGELFMNKKRSQNNNNSKGRRSSGKSGDRKRSGSRHKSARGKGGEEGSEENRGRSRRQRVEGEGRSDRSEGRSDRSEVRGDRSEGRTGSKGKNVHRDKARGRHRGSEEEQQSKSGGGNKKRRRRNYKGKDKNNQNRSQKSAQGRNQKGKKSASSSKPKGLLSKVSSAFKRLFG